MQILRVKRGNVMAANIIFLIAMLATFFTLGHACGRAYELKRQLKRENEAYQEALIKKYTVDID